MLDAETTDEVNFFTSLDGLDPVVAFELSSKQSEKLRDEFAKLQESLAQTARGDKKTAHEIKQKIASTQAKLTKLKPILATLRAASEKRVTHWLWVEGVTAVCGKDKLKEVYDWMAAEKKRRRQDANG